jgi:hypothetical protein
MDYFKAIGHGAVGGAANPRKAAMSAASTIGVYYAVESLAGEDAAKKALLTMAVASNVVGAARRGYNRTNCSGQVVGGTRDAVMAVGATTGAGAVNSALAAANGDDPLAALASGMGLWNQAAGALTPYLRSCFAADMLIDCGGGKKRADAISVGDKLWSRTEFDPTGPLELKEVEEVFVWQAPIWTVQLPGQILRTTVEHPFYVQGRGWLPTEMLAVGDLLLTRSGVLVPVVGVADSGTVETVYNWRVAEYHTYFVSAEPDGFSVWAHNACENIRKVLRDAKQYDRSTQTWVENLVRNGYSQSLEAVKASINRRFRGSNPDLADKLIDAATLDWPGKTTTPPSKDGGVQATPKQRKPPTRNYSDAEIAGLAEKYIKLVTSDLDQPYTKKDFAPKASKYELSLIRHKAREIAEKRGITITAPTNKQGHADFKGYYYKHNGKDLDNVRLPEFDSNGKRLWGAGQGVQETYLNNLVFGNSNTPAGYVWHHHQESGRMQLVKRGIHQATSHIGGAEEGGWSAGTK